jgi:hypothetical protein
MDSDQIQVAVRPRLSTSKRAEKQDSIESPIGTEAFDGLAE